jgi:hypothetical protein
VDRTFLRVFLTMIRWTEGRGFHMRISYVAVGSHEDPSSSCSSCVAFRVSPEGHTSITIRVHST